MGMYLMSMHLMSVYLIGMHLTGMYLIGIYGPASHWHASHGRASPTGGTVDNFSNDLCAKLPRTRIGLALNSHSNSPLSSHPPPPILSLNPCEVSRSTRSPASLRG
jgi:hypothetical protein